MNCCNCLSFNITYLKRKKLRFVIEIKDGHFCRSRQTREAVAFDLQKSELRNSFHAMLEVVLHAATGYQRSTVDKVLTFMRLKSSYQDISENIRISIPPVTVSKGSISSVYKLTSVKINKQRN